MTCPTCGSTGIHACAGAPMEPWTPEKIAELHAALAQYEPEPAPLSCAGDAPGDGTLLPCPFCGGDAQTDFIEGESYLIECYSCRAQVGAQDCEQDAVDAWNRRA